MHLLTLFGKLLLVKGISDVNPAIRSHPVNVHCANIALLNNPRNGTDHIPLTHESMQIHKTNSF